MYAIRELRHLTVLDPLRGRHRACTRLAFDAGFTHYDDPPPAELGDLEELRAADRFRFANVLRAWIEVDDAGRITGGGYGGGGLMGPPRVRLGGLTPHLPGASRCPTCSATPEHGRRLGAVRPDRRRPDRPARAPAGCEQPPFVQWQAPLVWTTLSLTLHADGRAEYRVTGASPFPRHWVYDADGRAGAQVGPDRLPQLVRAVSFGRAHAVGRRGLPGAGHRGRDGAGAGRCPCSSCTAPPSPRIEQAQAGHVLVRQGDPGTDIYLVLDGVIRVERDGERLAEYGPGALLGERAVPRGRRAHASRWSRSPGAGWPSVHAGQFDHAALAELSGGHRREDAVRG